MRIPLALPPQLIKFVTHGGRPPIPEPEALPGVGSSGFQGLGAYIELIQRCWAQTPGERPSFPEISEALRCVPMMNLPVRPAQSDGSHVVDLS